MKKIFFYILSAFIKQSSNAQQAVQISISDTWHQKISKYIYGHFAENFGRCIYDGFWAGSNLNIPKNDRIRLDAVDALKKINIPDADQYHWHSEKL